MNVNSLFTPDPTRATDDGPNKPYDVLLIDGGGMVVTSWATTRNMERAEDRVRSGVYVFLTTLASLASMIKSKGTIVCVWDGVDNRAFRRGMHPWYKHGRGSVINRDEVRVIMSEMSPILEAMGISQSSIPKHEADDVIATLADRYASKGNRVVIFSDDHDYRQLIDENIHLCRRSLNGIILSPNQCRLNNIEFGERYLHAKAIHGDTGDNIKGLQGIGEKKAYSLLDLNSAVVSQILDDYTEVDWSFLCPKEHKTLRGAFVRAGRKITFPVPISPANKKFAEKRRRHDTPLNSLEVSEEDALIIVGSEIAKCLRLVTMDRNLDVEEVQVIEPNHHKIPKIMLRMGMQDETDLYSSLYKLAGVLHPDVQPSWRAVVRTGKAIAPEDLF